MRSASRFIGYLLSALAMTGCLGTLTPSAAVPPSPSSVPASAALTQTPTTVSPVGVVQPVTRMLTSRAAPTATAIQN